MRKVEVMRFEKIVAEADRQNKSKKDARFFPLEKRARNGFLTEIGLYDGQTKKYTLIDTRHHTVGQVLKEMEVMLGMK